jgi:hypothetical protein
MFTNNDAHPVAGDHDADLDTLRSQHTLEYIDPPHAPQLVKNIVVMHGKDKAEVIALIRAAGIQVTEAQLDVFRKGVRTDKPRRPM